MKIIKKLFKIIIIVLAVFMGVSACTFNNKNNTAFADTYNDVYSEENKQYILLKEGATFYQGATSTGSGIYNKSIIGGLKITFNNGNEDITFWYPCMITFGEDDAPNIYKSDNDALLLRQSADNNDNLYLAQDFYAKLPEELTINLTRVYVSTIKINYFGADAKICDYNDYASIINVNQYENGYQNGYQNGAEEERLKNSVGVLYGTRDIKLNFYANDVAGVVATVDNATVHYTNGGLNFAPYNEEYESIITGYQPEYPENFIDHCEVIINTELFIVEDINNTMYDYAIENLILNYPTTFYGDDVSGYVRQPTVELQFGFGPEFGGTDWIFINVEELRGTSQDYLTLNKEELRPYYDYAQGYLTGIKITYYDRDIFSFYEPNALLTVDKYNNVAEYVDGLDTGYSNGYITGEQNGYEKGFQDAVSGGYDGQGLFAGAVAFMRLFFELIGEFLERKFIGDITFGLILIGIPATFMIIDLIISLIRKMMGKSGGE